MPFWEPIDRLFNLILDHRILSIISISFLEMVFLLLSGVNLSSGRVLKLNHKRIIDAIIRPYI
jgi:hypothetical protein